MPVPDGLPQPVSNAALRRAYAIAEDTNLRADVRDTCLVALSAVGRMEWSNDSRNAPNTHKGIYNWTEGVNCWGSVLKFAVLSGAMTPTQTAKWVEYTNGASSVGMGATQKLMVDWLYDKVPRTQWQSGCVVPIGAMVYHSRLVPTNTNEIAHCTLHVGGNMIIGSWRANVGPQNEPVLHAAVKELNDRGWNGDTLYTGIDAFGDMQWLSYSNGPFWDYL